MHRNKVNMENIKLTISIIFKTKQEHKAKKWFSQIANLTNKDFQVIKCARNLNPDFYDITAQCDLNNVTFAECILESLNILGAFSDTITIGIFDLKHNYFSGYTEKLSRFQQVDLLTIYIDYNSGIVVKQK